MAIKSHNHSVFSKPRCEDYIQALEDERRKIEVFRRELPLCLELVTQAIESCKQQLSGIISGYECLKGQSSDVPFLEEFIPIKRDLLSDSEDIEEQSKIDCNNNKDLQKNVEDKNIKKSDWLRSVQLWNQTPDLLSIQDDSAKKSEVKRDGSGGGAFHPFKKQKNGEAIAPPPSTSSTAETGGTIGGENKNKEKERQSRKARRCWSPELHKRFLQALHQLGGSRVATPKQIRELMKVDGLTNDEVKSHLQKFRLHTRRTSPSAQTTTTTQTTQLGVVTRGLWMPSEYTTTSALSVSNGINAPSASLSPPFQESPDSPKRRQHKTSNTTT